MPYQCDRICTTLPPNSIAGFEVIQVADPESDRRPAVATFALTT